MDGRTVFLTFCWCINTKFYIFRITFSCATKVEDAGLMAAVPSELVAELARRRDMAGSVADTSLADSLSLFLWLAENVESPDHQLLVTQVSLKFFF